MRKTMQVRDPGESFDYQGGQDGVCVVPIQHAQSHLQHMAVAPSHCTGRGERSKRMEKRVVGCKIRRGTDGGVLKTPVD